MKEEKKQPEQEHNAGIDMLPEIEPETCRGTTIDEWTHTTLVEMAGYKDDPADPKSNAVPVHASTANRVSRRQN